MRRSIIAKWNVVNQQLSFLFSQTIIMTDRRKMIVTNVTMTPILQTGAIQSLMQGANNRSKVLLENKHFCADIIQERNI